MTEVNSTIIIALLGFLFVLIGILSGVVVFLLLKNSEKRNRSEVSSIEKETQHQETTAFCHIHEKEHAKGTCSICSESFCESCLKEHEGMTFCPEHLKTFCENKWVDITNIKTTPNNPEAAVYVYEFKKELWKQNNTPAFIVTHYKINIDGDHIESYVMLYVRSQDEEVLKNKLNQIN